ncbi:MAG: 4'-phosphopantetheinyl transferase superfamily protein [Bacteroidetes bacterium]|uniref:4'-phosphopantetheinyl transferase superfamily protein n=1 Tax=Candidatus Cryptobacteroides excrementavium TaxID=2840759 RepID=A0A9D9J4S3_9BACT|nr:4'-phosphopantetheinyl transferase superfamily protein [Candidatus Cryptobacteroides excrementavium]
MGLYFRKTLEDKAEISVWKITETEDELMKLSSVPTDEMEEISLIRNSNVRKQKLAVRALLNEVFEDKVYLSHHDNGKPFLENCITNISITHTDKYVAIITHQEEDLGIDMECIDRDFTAVKEKALSDEEREELEDDDRVQEQLAIYWCAKEAIFKRMSQNKVDFSEQILVSHFNPKDEGELEATFIHKDGYEEEFELGYTTFDRHVLVWVVG